MPLTIGIEEEYQIIDPTTRGLRSYLQRLLERGQAVLPDQLRPEFLQSQLEAGTRVCQNIQEARDELVRMRRSIWKMAEREGLWVAAAGTHPFSLWDRQKVSPFGCYPELALFLQDVGRRLLIFGLHIHLGIEEEELRIQVMNQMSVFLPHLLALSTSSPFWYGRNTGLKSYRSVLFESLPRTGLPPQFDSFADYRNYVDLLLVTHSIAAPTHVWWDARPSEKFPTLEIRIADMCTRVDEAVCIAALAQAIAAKLLKITKTGQPWNTIRRHLIEENKWRVVRYGIEGKLIDFSTGKENPCPASIESLILWVDDVIDELGSREEIEYAHVILSQGTSAERQLAKFHQTQSFEAVVDQVVEETCEGIE